MGVLQGNTQQFLMGFYFGSKASNYFRIVKYNVHLANHQGRSSEYGDFRITIHCIESDFYKMLSLMKLSCSKQSNKTKM